MQEEFDDALKVEVLTNMLRMGKAEASELVETLANQLQNILPEITKVERAGWILSSQRPVKTLTVRFNDAQLSLTKDKLGVHPQVTKIVRDVALKTTSITLDEWISLLASELSRAAQSDANTRETLSKFTIG